LRLKFWKIEAFKYSTNSGEKKKFNSYFMLDEFRGMRKKKTFLEIR
jgi:hypothetical protein